MKKVQCTCHSDVLRLLLRYCIENDSIRSWSSSYDIFLRRWQQNESYGLFLVRRIKYLLGYHVMWLWYVIYHSRQHDMSSQTTASIAPFSWSMNIFPKCRSLASYTSSLSSCQSGRFFLVKAASVLEGNVGGLDVDDDHDTIFISHASYHKYNINRRNGRNCRKKKIKRIIFYFISYPT